jgi:ankyrin repeat protein
MIQRGVDVNAQSDISLETPLFQACLKSRHYVVEALLSNGADINKKNRHKMCCK